MSVTLELFRNETDVEHFAAGETIFREGDRGNSMYVVLDGSVTLSANGQVVETLGPGGVLGEVALIDQWPRAATPVAQSACGGWSSGSSAPRAAASRCR
jgi:CRP/FNR family transcriptional regulator, cyclic AMP receptor protein